MDLPGHLAAPKIQPAQPVIESDAQRATNELPPAGISQTRVETVVAQPAAKMEEKEETSDRAKEVPPPPSQPAEKVETKAPHIFDSPASKGSEPISVAPVSPAGPSVSVFAEPITGSKLERAIGKVPLLRRFKSHEDVAGPVPVHEAQPTLRLTNQQPLTQRVSVDVKVDVAESGKVRAAEITGYGDPPNFTLANAALAAARQWTFTPAVSEDVPTSSQVILHFHFNP